MPQDPAGSRPLKICFVAAEVTPFAKTGGLGDVSAALPRTLHRLGHDVRLFLPFYARIDRGAHRIAAVDFLRDIPIELGGRRFRFSVYATEMPRSNLPLYLIHCPALFDRPEIYTGGTDDAIRFALLTRAAIECCQRMGFAPDVFHANDWHTALLPLYLKTVYAWDELFARSKTVLTIHNIGYQGVFPAEIVPALGLGEHAAKLHQGDLGGGRVGFLKTGILHADVVTTVSPTHAAEIRTPEYGMGLDALLRQRVDELVGILNGVDSRGVEPADRPADPDPVLGGRPRGQGLLQAGADGRSGAGSRLRWRRRWASSPGWSSRRASTCCARCCRRFWPTCDCRLAALGSGETAYEEFFAALQRRFPGPGRASTAATATSWRIASRPAATCS